MEVAKRAALVDGSSPSGSKSVIRKNLSVGSISSVLVPVIRTGGGYVFAHKLLGSSVLGMESSVRQLEPPTMETVAV